MNTTSFEETKRIVDWIKERDDILDNIDLDLYDDESEIVELAKDVQDINTHLEQVSTASLEEIILEGRLYSFINYERVQFENRLRFRGKLDKNYVIPTGSAFEEALEAHLMDLLLDTHALREDTVHEELSFLLVAFSPEKIRSTALYVFRTLLNLEHFNKEEDQKLTEQWKCVGVRFRVEWYLLERLLVEYIKSNVGQKLSVTVLNSPSKFKTDFPALFRLLKYSESDLSDLKQAAKDVFKPKRWDYVEQRLISKPSKKRARVE